MESWYLINAPHYTNGDETVGVTESTAFDELLNTEIADDVELCNYDLSVCTMQRAIIQGKTQDTKLKSLNRQILFPIGTCKAGMYVKYNNRYWLIVGLTDSNVIYEKAVMTLCNYQLTWISPDGRIIQRWASVNSASQYNNGETGQEFYTIRTDQLIAILPDDDDSILVDSGNRFIIDRRCQIYERNFDESVECDTSNSVFVYESTRSDTVLFDYQDSGHMEFLLTQKEKQKDDGYYKINGKGYWIAGKPNVPTVSEKPSLGTCFIEDIVDAVLCGVEPASFNAKFYDESGNEIKNVVFHDWQITCDFYSDLQISYANNAIVIYTENEKLVNKKFILTLYADGFKDASKEVFIKSFF